MIHVQIASRLTLAGVDGIRWVLVDNSDAPPPEAPSAPAPVAAAVAKLAPAEVAARGRTSLALMKSLVMGAGFGAAIWMAQSNFGPPTVRWWQDPPEPPKAGTVLPVPRVAPPPDLPPTPRVAPPSPRSTPRPAGDAKVPLAPEPEAPAASGTLPTLTASKL